MTDTPRRNWKQFATSQIGAAIIALGIGGPFFYWYFDQNAPTTILSAAVRTPLVKQGGYLVVDYTVMRHRECPGQISRMILDSQGMVQMISPYDFQGVNHTSPSQKPTSIAVPVPVSAAPGQAAYSAVIDYFCNPLQRAMDWPIRVKTDPITFIITKGDGDPVAPPPPDPSRDIGDPVMGKDPPAGPVYIRPPQPSDAPPAALVPLNKHSETQSSWQLMLASMSDIGYRMKKP